MTTENLFPERLSTGVGRQTIQVPKGHFYGHPDEFDFRLQLTNYQSLKEVLDQGGLQLTLMSAAYRFPEAKKQMRFVVIAGTFEKPVFIWEKYEGNSPAGAQNRVYVDGHMYRLSSFLSMDELRRAMHLIQV
jgi:hypothetical protein